MANVAQSRATGPLFFLKTGYPKEILVASGNWATANFEHWVRHLQLSRKIIIVCRCKVAFKSKSTSTFSLSHLR